MALADSALVGPKVRLMRAPFMAMALSGQPFAVLKPLPLTAATTR